MLNLVNKIVTVLVTLVVMINYCNGFITDKNVFLDTEKFTTEKIETCEQFNEVSSQYIVNNSQYFFDGKGNYYALHYKNVGTKYIYVPFGLYELETENKSGEFRDCKDGVIYFEFNQKQFTFNLKDIHFLKPVDTFVQPPELRDADIIGTVTTCKEFNDKVIQQNTSGFLIFKTKRSNLFSRVCLWKGCALSYYSYFRPAKTELLRPNPFGFYWREKIEGTINSKQIYQDCDNHQLYYIKYVNGEYDDTTYNTLSNLTFYNIKPKTRRLEDIQSHLWKKLSTCEQFEEYLKQDKYILDGYIYFDYIGNPKKTIYYAIKVNLHGPEESRERAYVLNYEKINSRYKGFSPFPRPRLFVGCKKQVSKSDTLIYELDGDPMRTFFVELKDLLFYDVNEPLSEGPSGIEMQYLN